MAGARAAPDVPVEAIRRLATWTWEQAYRETGALAQGLADLGGDRGDRVAIAGANRVPLGVARTTSSAASSSTSR